MIVIVRDEGQQLVRMLPKRDLDCYENLNEKQMFVNILVMTLDFLDFK